MIKNLTKCFICSIVFVFMFFNAAFATVASVYDIQSKIKILNKISTTNYLGFINKSELIGDRLYNFNMLTEHYKSEALSLSQHLEKVVAQIDEINNSKELSQSEKGTQVYTLYTETNNLINSFHSGTMRYLMDIQGFMPTITYTRYTKKFKTYFNSLNLTEQDIPL